jgi:hypothetical protein
MHIFYDCFRAQATTLEVILKLAGRIFPERVSWLKRLIKGTISSILMTDDGHRVTLVLVLIEHLFGIIEKNASFGHQIDLLLNRFNVLNLLFHLNHGQITYHAEEIFLLYFFLHKYQPYPSYTDPKLDENFRRNNYLCDSVRPTLINQQISSITMHLNFN